MLYSGIIFCKLFQKVCREGQLIVMGAGRLGNSVLQILKRAFSVTDFSQRVHIQNQNSWIPKENYKTNQHQVLVIFKGVAVNFYIARKNLNRGSHLCSEYCGQSSSRVTV